jgi:hypothetical protein
MTMDMVMTRIEPGEGPEDVADEIDAAVADGTLSPDHAALAKQRLSAEIAKLLERIRRS